MNLIRKIIIAGVLAADEFEFSKRLVLNNQLLILIIAVSSPYIILFSLIGSKIYGLFVGLVDLIFIFCLYLNHKRLLLLSRLLFVNCLTLIIYCYASIFGPESGLQFSLIIAFSISFIIFEKNQIIWKWVSAIFPIFLFFILEIYNYAFYFHFELTSLQYKWLSCLVIFCVALMISFIIQFLLNINNLLHTITNQLITFPNLTKRECEITAVLIEGKTNKEIATILFIEETTVKNHLQNIYQKLNINTRLELMKKLTPKS